MALRVLTQLQLTLCDNMDCSPPGPSVHEIIPARILEWAAISYSRGSSQPRIGPESPASTGRFLTTSATINLNCVLKGPISKYTHTGAQYMNLGGCSSDHDSDSCIFLSIHGYFFNTVSAH